MTIIDFQGPRLRRDIEREARLNRMIKAYFLLSPTQRLIVDERIKRGLAVDTTARKLRELIQARTT